MRQSKGGVENIEYRAQRSPLKNVDAGEIEMQDFHAGTGELFQQEIEGDS